VSYHPRVVDQELDRLLKGLPAVAIEGAKAVGKTATAQRRAARVLTLDAPRTRLATEADPEAILTGQTPLLIDEWQLVPPVWDVVRRAVDHDRTPGRFLLAGSALPAPQVRIHSGAGRIVRLLMRPMTLPERGVGTPTVSLESLLSGTRPPVSGTSSLRLADYVVQIVESGFPGIRQDPPDLRPAMIGSYIDQIVERDIPELGAAVRRPNALRAWMAAYAAATATTASYTSILDSATAGVVDKPARATVDAYRKLLQRIWVLDPLPAWIPVFNPLKRLAQAPKHHLVDPALAARLLGATAQSLVDGIGQVTGPENLLAALFESLAVLSVRVFASRHGAQVSHLRTRGGDHEIDIIVERDDHRILPIEVKLTSAPTERDARHLDWLERELGGTVLDTVLFTTGEHAYRTRSGVAVVPLALLGP
jgi:predicted AAA+ superfamily ATPase